MMRGMGYYRRHGCGVRFDLLRAVFSTSGRHDVLYESFISGGTANNFRPRLLNPERLQCELTHALAITI
jgi:hypothetical protein